MTEELLSVYRAHYLEVLLPVAEQLRLVLTEHLGSVDRIDRIATRAKSPARFAKKASKINPDGSAKYPEPLQQIQDQIGARVIVFYTRDVATVSEVVRKYLRGIETKSIIPDSEWKFGYFGLHHILALPSDAVPKSIALDKAPTFFELQVKTLFQHAWSEAEHDLGYKPAEGLSDDQKRRLAFTAAQAWGADRIFQELFEELG